MSEMITIHLPTLGDIHPNFGYLLFSHEDGEYSVMDLAHRNPAEKKFSSSRVDLTLEAWNWLVQQGFEEQIEANEGKSDNEDHECLARITAKCYAIRKISRSKNEVRVIESVERRIHHVGRQVKINWAPERHHADLRKYQEEMKEAIFLNKNVVGTDDETRESFERTRKKEMARKNKIEIERLKRELGEKNKKFDKLKSSNAEDIEEVEQLIEEAEEEERETESIQEDFAIELQKLRISTLTALKNEVIKKETLKKGAEYTKGEKEKELSKKKDGLSKTLSEIVDLKAALETLKIEGKGMRDERDSFHIDLYKLEPENKENENLVLQIEELQNQVNQLTRELQEDGNLSDQLESLTRQYNLIMSSISPFKRKPTPSNKRKCVLRETNNLLDQAIPQSNLEERNRYLGQRLRMDVEEADAERNSRETKEDALCKTTVPMRRTQHVPPPNSNSIKEEFLALPDSAKQLINEAWTREFSQEALFVNEFDIAIRRKDLLTLSGLNWLNDNIITYYLQLIVQRSTVDSRYPKVYAFNTFFYTNIVKKGYASVKRWTLKVDIFSYDILLVPVDLGFHWCMAVIDMTRKRVEFYDSLYKGNEKVLPALQGYLASESMDKKKVPFDFSGWILEEMEKISEQKNGSDCGVFSCQFAEWAARRKAPAFSQTNMPYYRQRMVYEIVTKTLLATI